MWKPLGALLALALAVTVGIAPISANPPCGRGSHPACATPSPSVTASPDLAFPTIAGTVANTADATAATSRAVNLPSGITSGELLLMFMGSGAATTYNATGWTDLLASNAVYGILYRIADGSEGATVTVTTASTKLACIVFRVTNWFGSGIPAKTTLVSGSSTAPDPGALTPAWGAADTLWFAFEGSGNGATATVYPTNYADNQTTVAATGGSAATRGGAAVATRNLNNASDDPSAFTISTSASWGAFTIGVRPAPAATAPYANPYPQLLAH